MWSPFKKKASNDSIEYPRIARISVKTIPCHTCGGPIVDNDLVVWSEKKDGCRSELSHAHCVVFIRHPDGSTTNLSGEEVKTNRYGGIFGPVPVGALLLTEAEWSSWSALNRKEAVNLSSQPLSPN
jgi:hypothetical protein